MRLPQTATAYTKGGLTFAVSRQADTLAIHIMLIFTNTSLNLPTLHSGPPNCGINPDSYDHFLPVLVSASRQGTSVFTDSHFLPLLRSC